jgi:hypothetical protein
MTLIKLHTLGGRWYAGIREGNLTIGGLFGAPTAFPASMSRDDVIAAIKRSTPEIEIELPCQVYSRRSIKGGR